MMETERLLLLVEVEFRHENGWSRARPLFGAGSRKWVAVDDAVTEYPTQGLIFWHSTPPEATKGTFWIVEVAGQGAPDAFKKDLFRVTDTEPVRVYQVYADAGLSNQLQLRRAIAYGQLKLPTAPVGPLFIKMPGESDVYVGPVAFSQDSPDGVANGRYTLDEVAGKGFVETRVIARDVLQHLDFGGSLVTVLRPGQTIGASTGVFNVQDDEQLLRSTLKRIRKIDRNVADALRMTQSAHAAYVEALSDADLIGADALREAARESAASELLEVVDESVLQRNSIADALLDRPSVREDLERAISAEIQKRIQDIRKEAEATAADQLGDVAKLKDTQDTIAGEIGEARSELSAVRQRIAEAEREYQGLSSEMKAKLEKVVDEVLANPVAEIARNVVVSSILGTTARLSPRPPSSSTVAPARGKPIKGTAEIRGRLIAANDIYGFGPEAMYGVVATLLAGRPALAGGLRAADLTQCAAAALVGANAWRCSVPTSIFSLDDFLGLPAIRVLGDSAEASSLGAILSGSQDEDVMSALILEGLNRAPLEVAFDSFVMANPLHRGSRKIAWRRTEGGVGAYVESIRITGNVLLLGSLVGGATTFRVPVGMRRLVGMFDADRDPAVPEAAPSVEVLGGAHLPIDSWELWRGECSATSLGELVIPRCLTDEMIANVSDLQIFHGVYEDEDRALAEWLIARALGGISEATFDSVLAEMNESVREMLTTDAAESAKRNIKNTIEGVS